MSDRGKVTGTDVFLKMEGGFIIMQLLIISKLMIWTKELKTSSRFGCIKEMAIWSLPATQSFTWIDTT